jgi:ribosomal protein S18 acetylase RimI-like enzyme
MSTALFRIRPCLPADEDAAYQVCLKTGDSGDDGTLLFPEDPRALGNLFVGPYIYLEPDLAFVLEDDQGVCGYVLAALDSGDFYRRLRAEWLPHLRAQHPCPKGDPAAWTPTQRIHYEFHYPDLHYPPTFRPYPSHLHIDLLPRAQGRGQGRRMMEYEMVLLAQRGSPGVHLGLSAVNQRAYQFYRRLGFIELERVANAEAGVIYLGKRLLAGKGSGEESSP